MKPFSIAMLTAGMLTILVPSEARAQQADFQTFTAGVGSILRSRQLSDATPLGKGRVEFGVQLTPEDDAKPAWNGVTLDASTELPAVVARVGVGRRVDVGAWGRINTRSDYAVAGIDTRILLLRQGPSMPVSVAIRPAVAALIGPSQVWAANASIDFSASRTIGAFSPYVGVATTGSVALERSRELDLDPATADRSLSYAGLTYRWRRLGLSAEVEKAADVTYGLRVTTRF
jgi:hypothetical protein